jgi:hypothetical protein
MYFGVSWIEPRLKINDSASEWTEIKTGPPDEINVSPEALQHIWSVLAATLQWKNQLYSSACYTSLISNCEAQKSM